MSDKLSIKSETAALDRKDRNFYESLTDEEKKKFSPYLMLRYSACVEGNADLQAWYLMATNERVNKNFFDVSTTQHKKLQWLMCTTVSPDMGNQRHYWLGSKKSDKDNKAIKFLTSLYPELKSDDIELLTELNSKEDLRNLARQHGWDDKRIKSDL
jgi:hypothetical protein